MVKPSPEQSEWDQKALEIFNSIYEKDPTLPEIRKRVLRKLGPRPGTRTIEESPGTIHVLERLNSRRGWHKLQCSKETKDRIWAMKYAEIEIRPSGWYDMKITKKGRKFLRSLDKENDSSVDH